MAKQIRVGDCFAIPLADGRYGYCQYVQWHDQYGYLIRVFDQITENLVLSGAKLRVAREMFPPVFIGLSAAVSSGRWKFLVNLPVEDFQFPMFRCTSATRPGTYENWWIWDGKREEFIGKLPQELRALEIRGVWGAELLEERIATGKDPFGRIL